jgi:hypothetical protein
MVTLLVPLQSCFCLCTGVDPPSVPPLVCLLLAFIMQTAVELVQTAEKLQHTKEQLRKVRRQLRYDGGLTAAPQTHE